jgi:rhodanese-related sulfurtransferase
METPVIDRGEVMAALGRGQGVALVMALNDWAYQAAHIPGSVRCDGPAPLSRDDEIIVYCAGAACQASRVVARRLAREGYRKVRRYAGGLADWAAAGLPLEGALAV